MKKEQKIHPLDEALLSAAALGSYADIDHALRLIDEQRIKRFGVAKVSKWISIARNGDSLGICSRSRDGSTALMLAAKAGREPCMMLLLDQCDGGPASLGVEREALIEAAARGNVAFVKAVLGRRLKAGLSWSELDGQVEWREPMRRCSPVSAAIHGGSNECLSLLISAGFSVGGRVNGLCSVSLAIYRGSPDMVRMLLAAGASVSQVDDYGVTPLMSAACKGFSGVVHDLLEKGKGATLNDVDREGMTALGYAIQFKKIDSAKVLSAAGGVLDRGRDPLAAAKGRAAVARACLSFAIEASAKDAAIDELSVFEGSEAMLPSIASPAGAVGPVGPTGAVGPSINPQKDVVGFDLIADEIPSGSDDPDEPVGRIQKNIVEDAHVRPHSHKEKMRRLKASFSG